MWDNKGRKVNSLLKVLCISADIPYIDNNNITKIMLNYINLHLDTTDTTILISSVKYYVVDKMMSGGKMNLKVIR